MDPTTFKVNCQKAYVFLFRACSRFRKISHFAYSITTKIISHRIIFFRRPKISMISNLQAPDLPVVNSLAHLCCYTYTKCSTIESKLLPLLSVSVPFLKTNSYEKKIKKLNTASVRIQRTYLYFSTHAKRQCLFQIKKYFPK